MLALIVAIAVLVIANLFIGSVEIPVRDICKILVGAGFGSISSSVHVCHKC